MADQTKAFLPVTIPRELFDFLMGDGEIDGTSFGDLNDRLPGRFWWRALMRTAEASQSHLLPGDVGMRGPYASDDDLIEAAVQAALDSGLAENGVRGVGAARHAARFVVESREYWRNIERANLADEVRQIKEAKQAPAIPADVGMNLAAAFGPILKEAFPDHPAQHRHAACDALANAVIARASWFAALTPSPCPGDVGMREAAIDAANAHLGWRPDMTLHSDAHRRDRDALADLLVDFAEGRGGAPTSFPKCAARNANTGANDPQDCNWPVCGCDPVADKVIAALDEMGLLAALTPSALSGDAGEGKPWPGCYADLQQRRVIALAKAGLMLSRMAADDVSEAFGQDPADLFAEVLMALAIEDAEDTDIALEIARDHPDGDILAARCVGATGQWMKVGTFDPEPDALYLVQGLLRTSVKRGSEIQEDNVAAALIAALSSHQGAGEP